ncbi:MAG: polyprenyl synthetase family protein [Chloroflexi bacterium]|nr:polyprenyl synthetase family protein [Chloroflexota bacterium]
MNTSLIYGPVEKELAQAELQLKGLARSGSGSDNLASLLSYTVGTSGKRVRPALTLLASKFGPIASDRPVTMAVAVELLHIATLIHDDTVDNSSLRRGQATVSNLWGRNVAVLLGDYIFAASATFVCSTNNVPVIRRFSETIMELSQGELMEIFGANDSNTSLDTYWQRIYNKTASLFSTAAESGAILNDASPEVASALRDYGKNLGLAFQVIDDILDLQATQQEVGKPVGNDLLQGVLTLPSLLLLQRYPEDNPIPKLFQGIDPQENLARAITMVQERGLIQESYKTAQELCQKARAAIAPLPDLEAKASLLALTDYVLSRRH